MSKLNPLTRKTMTRSINFPLVIVTIALSLSSPLLGVSGKGSDVPKPIRREVYEGGKIYDISHRYTAEIPAWESSEGLGKQFLRLAASMKNGSFANVSEMKLSVHSGTHVDAPGHFWDNYYDAGFDSDTLDLRVLNGNYHFRLFLVLSWFIVFLWVSD